MFKLCRLITYGSCAHHRMASGACMFTAFGSRESSLSVLHTTLYCSQLVFQPYLLPQLCQLTHAHCCCVVGCPLSGFGSTPDFPTSCQQCPVGTYSNSVGEIINIPGVPPKGGKGITTPTLVGATILPCRSCCPAGEGTCGYTTRRPGSTSFSDCILADIPAQ
jgi:hypothetical protein